MTETAAHSETIGLNGYIRDALLRYFADLEGHAPGNLYELLLGEVERPLLEVVLNETGGNQSRAAEILGINRATLRKKLRQYGLGQ